MSKYKQPIEWWISPAIKDTDYVIDTPRPGWLHVVEKRSYDSALGAIERVKLERFSAESLFHECVYDLEFAVNQIKSLRSLSDGVDAAVDALEMVRDADEDCIKDGLPRWCTDAARAKIDEALSKLRGGHE